MSDVLFKASLQNTLNPEVGTFDNVYNKKGTFTLENGEYYLTNNTDTSYRLYYPTKDITYSVGFTTIEFDVNYNHSYSSVIHPCLLFNGDDNESLYGFGVADSTLYFEDGPNFPNREIVTSPSTWLHVKCIFDYNPDQSIAHIYIDNVEVINFTMGKNYDIKTIDILGNTNTLVHLTPDAKIKNITIYHSKKHYLDTPGLTLLWSKIKSLFATKTELASKVNTSDLSNYYTKPEVVNLLSNYYTKKQIDIMLNNAGSDKYGMNITADESEGGDDTQGGLSFYDAVERAPGYDGTSQMNISEDSNTVEDE